MEQRVFFFCSFINKVQSLRGLATAYARKLEVFCEIDRLRIAPLRHQIHILLLFMLLVYSPDCEYNCDEVPHAHANLSFRPTNMTGTQFDRKGKKRHNCHSNAQ